MEDNRQQATERLDLRTETRDLALRIMRLYSSLPKGNVAQTLGKQLLRSGTSVGAHYREACRAKSNADFVSKIEGALQELDETQYWIELLEAGEIVAASKLKKLNEDIDRLISILVSVSRKVK
ncbi:MAG: four helix bundle protein [Calditrichaeota bacterium]|nr:four helix bundle protein [Calditrichota bacterium]MCB9391356.1 four helix bundle protein [Calditrichota bacterium]